MGYDCDGFEKNENMGGENIKKDVCTSDRARNTENKKSGIFGNYLKFYGGQG